jgi:hypothetical protein
LFNVFFVSWFCLLGIGVVILRDVWARARVGEGSARADGDRHQAPAPIRPRQDADRPPLPRAVVVFRGALAAVGLAALLAFVYGDDQTKAAIAMAGTLIGTYAFFRGFLA